MANDHIKLEESWKKHLAVEFNKPYMLDLKAFLTSEKATGKTVYPPGPQIFAALNLTPLEKVKVVILGQDPYHGPGQAHGLSFSVPAGVRIPPSLVNIYAELENDLGVKPAPHGNLTSWAEQGVLLLNAVLTVNAHAAASHQKRGWERFTNRIIELVSAHAHPSAVVLWGSYAQKKAELIDSSRHMILKSAHPSPLSAHRGFLGSKPFSKINQFLIKTGQTPIDWRLPTEAFKPVIETNHDARINPPGA